MSDVIQVSSTEEYFAEDRDQVYCKHGTYTGYPGGPDFICGACEDGYTVIYRGLKITLRYRTINENGPEAWNDIETVYSFDKVRGWGVWFSLFAKATFEHEIEIVWDTYQFWGPEDENA